VEGGLPTTKKNTKSSPSCDVYNLPQEKPFSSRWSLVKVLQTGLILCRLDLTNNLSQKHHKEKLLARSTWFEDSRRTVILIHPARNCSSPMAAGRSQELVSHYCLRK